MAYLRCLQGVVLFLKVRKVIGFGCVLRLYGINSELGSPVKCSFALRVQLFSKSIVLVNMEL